MQRSPYNAQEMIVIERSLSYYYTQCFVEDQKDRFQILVGSVPSSFPDSTVLEYCSCVANALMINSIHLSKGYKSCVLIDTDANKTVVWHNRNIDEYIEENCDESGEEKYED